jgi:hypothetical protein
MRAQDLEEDMRITTMLVGLAVVALAVVGRADYVYKIDDGSAEMGFMETTNGPGVYGLNLLNQFTVQSYFDTITTISITIGYPGIGPLNGSPITLALWSDPNQDGNPSDGQVLTYLNSTVQNTASDVWTDYAITPTKVSGSFFAGYFISVDSTVSNADICRSDTEGTAGGTRSWLTETLNGGSIYDVTLPYNVLSDLGVPWDTMIRATGVPEPMTMVLLLGAGAAFFLRSRRHR